MMKSFLSTLSIIVVLAIANFSTSFAQKEIPKTVIANDNGIEITYEAHFVKTIEKKNGKSRDQYQLVVTVKNNSGKFLISPSAGLANVKVTNPYNSLEGANISYSGTHNSIEGKYELKNGAMKSFNNKFKVAKGATPSVTFSTNTDNFYEAPGDYLDIDPSGTWTSGDVSYNFTAVKGTLPANLQSGSQTVGINSFTYILGGATVKWTKVAKNTYEKGYSADGKIRKAVIKVVDATTIRYTSADGFVSTLTK